MKSSVRSALSVFALVLAPVLAPSTSAAVILDLNCILGSNSCTPTVSYGTITITDLAANQVTVTVDLAGTGEKFRDLRLNNTGAAGLSDTDDAANTVVFSANTFEETPYQGLFDIGDNTTQKNWNGDDGYTVTLTAPGLTEGSFNVADSLGIVWAALHIQNIDCSSGTCVPGSNGSGSLKIGARQTTVPPPPLVPEPASMLLFGMAGVAGAWRLRRRR